MEEWSKAKVSLDKYLDIECDVLISKGTTFDMLIGLNTYLAIGGDLTPNFLKYKVLIDKKERWGKIPLIKSALKKNDLLK